MGIFKKKSNAADNSDTPKKEKKHKKKERLPKYTNSLLNTQVLNYSEYYMNAKETLLYTVVLGVGGALAGYIMYGGIGSDESGNPTVLTHIMNIVVCAVSALLALKLLMPVMNDNLKRKRRNVLRRQFMDMLDSLAASVASGNNAVKSFEAARKDLVMQYGEDSFIVNELDILLEGQRNFIDIDKLLSDFGKRSGIREIESFAQVFAISYRKGGDFGKIIRDSYDILYNKINIEMEIETKVAATKNELNIMLIMPFVLIGMMKMSGGDFAHNFGTATGVLGTTVGVVIIAASYFAGRKITDIEV